MAIKDVSEKILEQYNDVFADIMNVLLFDGKQVIMEEDLVDVPVQSVYLADGQRWQERDVVKRWTKGDVCLAICGFENQSRVDPAMPLRVISYDGSMYRGQLVEAQGGGKGGKSGGRKKGRKAWKFSPVVTSVLHFGERSKWKKPLSLKDCLDVPEELQPYVSDYKINVFDIAFLDEETVKKFKSDFGVVAEYFLQKRRNRGYKPSEKMMRHVKEVMDILAALTGDVRYAELYEPEMAEKEVSMCEILDAAINKGLAQGRSEGLELGRSEGLELGRSEGLELGRSEGLELGEKRGIELGRNEGLELGETNIMNLIRYLVKNNRNDDITRLAQDKEYLEQLRAELEKTDS